MKKLTTKETAVLNEIGTRLGDWSDEVPCCEIFESVEKSSLPGVVSSLVKKGLVTSRREDGQDWLCVTDEGTAAIAEITAEPKL